MKFDETSLVSSVVILVLVFIAFTIPSVFPMAKGMKRAGDPNVIIAVALLLFVFLTGPTSYFMNTILGTLGGTFTQIVPISINAYPLLEKSWFNDWPLTTMIWWVSWTPFVGVFVARISKGRTLKEFILGSIFIPTIFMVLWFSIFGGYGLKDAVLGDGAANAPPMKVIIWALIMATVAFATIATGTIDGVRAVAVFLGIPYTFFLILQISGFTRSIRSDFKKGVLND